MPRQLTCTCNNCQTCAHRDYMRRWRQVVFPTDSAWERSVREMADSLCRYRCPLSTITAAAYCVDLRTKRKEKVMVAAE